MSDGSKFGSELYGVWNKAGNIISTKPTQRLAQAASLSPHRPRTVRVPLPPMAECGGCSAAVGEQVNTEKDLPLHLVCLKEETASGF